jgi:DNA-binding NtrC family response regulator
VPQEALRFFAADPARFDLVVTDQTMPGLTGIELARELLHIRPGLPVILTTGYAGTLTAERIRGLGIRELMMKPHSVRTTAETVSRVLGIKGPPTKDEGRV